MKMNFIISLRTRKVKTILLADKKASKTTHFYQINLPKPCQPNSTKLLVEGTRPVEPNQTKLGCHPVGGPNSIRTRPNPVHRVVVGSSSAASATASFFRLLAPHPAPGVVGLAAMLGDCGQCAGPRVVVLLRLRLPSGPFVAKTVM